MFTNPNEKMWFILIGCGVILFVLGIIIVIFHNEEKKEDEKKKPKINFDYF